MNRLFAGAAVRRLFSVACAGIVLASVFSVSEARADFTFNLGNLLVDDDFDTGNILLSATLPAGTYTSYEVTTNWTAGTGNPWSNEAIWDLSSESPVTASNVFYAFSNGSGTGAAANGNPVTLSWSGNFTTPYSVGDLYFNPNQTFPGSTANWNNTVVTLKNDPIVFPPPPSTSFPLPLLGGKFTATGELAPASVVWYDFVYGGEEIIIDTLGSQLTEGEFGVNDTELGLYDALGTFLGGNDDGFSSGFESQLEIPTGILTPGSQYFIAVGAYNTTFGAGFAATSTSAASGTFQLNVSVVPELGSVALLGIGGLLGVALAARRRRA